MGNPLELSSSALRWDHSNRLRDSGPRGWIADDRGRSLGRRLLHRRRVRPESAARQLRHMSSYRAVLCSAAVVGVEAEVFLCYTALEVCGMRVSAMEL